MQVNPDRVVHGDVAQDRSGDVQGSHPGCTITPSTTQAWQDNPNLKASLGTQQATVSNILSQ
jgi:hypothetical protein